jgi:hypothetical protein
MPLLSCQIPQPDCKQMRQLFSQANPSPPANHDHHARSSRKLLNQPHLTSPPGRTKTLTTDTTNAQYVLRMLRGVHGVFGRAGHAGLCSI